MGVRPFCQRVFVSGNHLKPLELCRLVYTRISSICIFEKWTFLDLRYSIPNIKKKTITVHPCMSCWSRYTRGFIFFSLPKLISPYHCARKNNVLHTYFVLHGYGLFKFESKGRTCQFQSISAHLSNGSRYRMSLTSFFKKLWFLYLQNIFPILCTY